LSSPKADAKGRGVESGADDVDVREGIVGDLAPHPVVGVDAVEGSLAAEPLELVEVGRGIGERHPTGDIARDERLVPLGEERVELGAIVRLGQADELPFAGDVEADEIGLGAEGVPDVRSKSTPFSPSRLMTQATARSPSGNLPSSERPASHSDESKLVSTLTKTCVAAGATLAPAAPDDDPSPQPTAGE
jgi:hypothetical protein